jgi:UDP-N-acetylmuramoyl-L-alanyl-D-glutamate--2,6-diaminopimelate ligase
VRHARVGVDRIPRIVSVSLPELVAVLSDPVLHGDPEGVSVTSLAVSTDAVTPGALFFCVRGSSADGHDFADAAVEAGAVALVVDRKLDLPPEVVQIQVEDVRLVMGLVADRFFDHPTRRLDVFGVTGTNGKTTTTHLVFAMLEAAGRAPGMIGTIGARIGDQMQEIGFTTPQAPDLQSLFAQMVDAGNKSCAIEVSSHALDQGRSSGTRYAAVGFTNLTQDHLDYHRSFEAYYQAKRKLFSEPGPEGQHWPAAINCDDDWGSRLFDELVHVDRGEMPVWGYTLHGMNRASVSAKYELTATGASITFESPVGEFKVKSKLRGRFNVENVVCAVTMALLAGLTPKEIQAGLDNVPGVRGRFEPVDAGQPFTVLVDYAHTPDSLEQVLSSARSICDGDLIVVFGCGGDRDRTKRPMMGRVAATRADYAIVTSDNPRSEDPDAIIAEIQKGMKKGAEVSVEPDRRAAIEAAIGMAEEGDVVVIAGKGHEQGQQFADETLPFDDATVAREALQATTVS